jgi:hypothetical protein
VSDPTYVLSDLPNAAIDGGYSTSKESIIPMIIGKVERLS